MKLARILPVVAVAALVAACSGGSSPRTATPPAPTATDAATATPAPTPTPALGGTAADGDLAFAQLQKLTGAFGTRLAGTSAEIAARDYLQGVLATYGYDVSIQPFTFSPEAFLPSSIDAGGAQFDAVGLRGSAGGTASGRFVVAGTGAATDVGPEARGAIVLIERGVLSFGDKADAAVHAGAVAAVIYNNVPGPFGGSLVGEQPLPVVAISQESGKDLVARIAAGPVVGSVTVSRDQATGYNVVARPRGVSQCTTLTGGHYDAVPGTTAADDDASGTVAVLETARLAAARNIPGANCFVLFSAEEYGLAGSKAYVESMADADVPALRVMMNLDVVGLAQPLTILGSDAPAETASAVALALGVQSSRGTLPLYATSDHASFRMAGMPVVMLYRDDAQIHTPEDNISRIAPASLRDTAAVAAGVLEALNRPAP